MEEHESSASNSDSPPIAPASNSSDHVPEPHASSPAPPAAVAAVAAAAAHLPPLDPRIFSNVVSSYEGETLQVPHCDVPVYHGRGRLVFRTGFVYCGDLYLGRMHGRGRIEWTSSGVVFEGDFVANEMRGRGEYTWPNGSSYTGDILAGKRHGRGVFVTGSLGVPSLNGPTGEDTAGDTLLTNTDSMEMLSSQSMDPLLHFSFQHQDDRNGDDNDEDQTNISAQSNARYEGQWVDGLPHGHGVLVYDDTSDVRYEGHFARGKREGQGAMRYASGNLYAGEWKSDVKRGFGVMKWMGPSNELREMYEGQWLDDSQHGFGRHVWLHARQKEKNYYEGEFARGLRHGLGVFYYANGARYEGEWRRNVKEGSGIFFYEDGRVFQGAFRDDRSVEAGAAQAMETAAAGTTTQSGSSGSGTAGSSTSARLLLYIDALLPVDGRDKARKAVEYAALRLNTELRALYRHYTKNSTLSSAGGVFVPSDESVLLMETFESRKLLAECGVHINSGHLEQLVEDIRSAQRQSVKAAAMVKPPVSIEDITNSCPTEENTISINVNKAKDTLTFLEQLQLRNTLPKDGSSCANIVPHNQLLLYREFVELLIRIAHWRRGEDAAEFTLAEAFTELHEQMARARLDLQSSSFSESWLGELRRQLHAKETQIVFKKHRVLLYKLFCACGAVSSERRPGDNEGEPSDEDDEDSSHNHPHAVSVRSLLLMLRHVDTMGKFELFGLDFKLRDAIRALEQVFTAPPSLHNHSDKQSDDESHKQVEIAEVDPFFSDTLLVYSEFLDAFAVVLYAKQQQPTAPEQLQSPNELGAPQLDEQPLPLPLYVLLDQFLQSARA